jgi:hypothetical protein
MLQHIALSHGGRPVSTLVRPWVHLLDSSRSGSEVMEVIIMSIQKVGISKVLSTRIHFLRIERLSIGLFAHIYKGTALKDF